MRACAMDLAFIYPLNPKKGSFLKQSLSFSSFYFNKDHQKYPSIIHLRYVSRKTPEFSKQQPCLSVNQMEELEKENHGQHCTGVLLGGLNVPHHVVEVG